MNSWKKDGHLAAEPTTLRRQAVAVLFITALLGQPSSAAPPTLPTGGKFAAGAGAINSSANALTVNQSSARAIIDWNSFSIGKNGLVNFNNGSGATLNRVTGGDMSSILGNLISSGSVYLINPQGVLIGPGANVNVGGDFIASTLNITNNDFLSGNSKVFKGDSHATVANLGSIFSKGGSVFLIGQTVKNSGPIKAPNGTVGLAAGSEILLKDSTSDGRVFVRAPGGDITNTGDISAAQVEIKSKGGNIYALAGNDGGQIAATGTATINGQTWLVADGGKTTVTAPLSAKNANGRGGNIETSGHELDITQATVKTGQGGNWLLDPVDVLIDSSAATTIQNSLATTNVTVQTTSSTASGPGTQTSGNGDIVVGSNIAWASANSLTLSAYRNITVNAGTTISNSGSGSLTLYADNAAAGLGTVSFAGTGASAAKVNFTGSGNISVYYHPTNFPTATSFTSSITKGTGTLTSYMTVDTLDNLQHVTNASGSYALNADIDASSVANFTPIPNLYSGQIFDGQMHTINNLTVNASGMAGLFVSNSGTIQNLILANESITGLNYTGGLVGMNNGTVRNSMTSGSVSSSGSSPYVGGLVGYSGRTVTASSSSAQVSGSSANSPTWVLIGGLVGLATGEVSNSYATGPVTISGTGNTKIGGGGLVGVQAGGTISNSYSTGTVTSTATGYNSQILGGLEGFVPSSGATVSATNSYWNTETSGLSTSQSGTGLTTAQLQASTYLTGFTSAYWTLVPNHAPYLNWQGTRVSGFVYNGTSPVAGATVSNLVGGSAISVPVTTGSDGSYGFFLPLGSIPSGGGVLAYLSAGGAGNTFTNGNYANTDIYTGTLRLLTATNSTYSGMISALNTALGSNTGANYLFTSTATTLSPKAGVNLAVESAGALTVDMDIASPGTLLLKAAGNLDLSGSALSANGSGAPLTLVTGGRFTSNANSTVNVTGSGRWLVYSQTPVNDTVAGDFTGYDFKQYQVADTSATLAQSMGNAFLYNTPGTISVGLTGVSKAYNQSATADLSASNFTSSGILAGDNVTINKPGEGTFVDPNAGTSKSITAAGLSLGTATDANGKPIYGYNLSSTNATGTGTISPLQLTETYTASNKTYDGTRTATATLGTLSGILSGDTVSIAGTPTFEFSDKTAGTGKTVSVSTLTLTGPSAANYTVTASQSGTADIAKATVTQTIAPSSRQYNGTTVAVGNLSGALSGVQGSDAVTVDLSNAHFNFLDKNVGNNKTVTSTGVVLSGADSGNYLLNLTTLPTNIYPALLQLSNSVDNKVYDGTTAATGHSTIGSAIFGSDDVSIASSSFTFQNKNAGTGKQVNWSATLTGADAGNYAIDPEISVQANITAAPLYYTAANVTRSYGASNPAFNGQVSGLVNGEALTSVATGSAMFSSSAAAGSNVGQYAINGSGLTLSNSNYQLSQAAGNSSALTITPAVLSGTVTANNKTYDATTTATGAIALTGIYGNDPVTLSGATLAFADKNVGTGKTVSASGATLTGTGSSNYILGDIATGRADITPAQLASTFTANSKVYDGTASANGALSDALTGVVSNDSVRLAGTPVFAFADKNAGSGKTVTATGVTLSGADAANYTLTLTQAGTASITPAQLLYVAKTGENRMFGADNPQFSGTVIGLAEGDALAAVSNGTAVFTSPATNASNVGTYAINGSGLTLTSGNYTLAQAPTNLNALTVNPAKITIGSVTRLSTQPNPTFTVSSPDASASYLQSLVSGLTLVTDAPANNAPGIYRIDAIIPDALKANVVVEPGTLTITAAAPSSTGAPFYLPQFPAALQTQVVAPPTPLSSTASLSNPLLPVNGTGVFQISIVPTPDASSTGRTSFASGPTSATDLSSASFAETAPDGRTGDHKSTFAAGAHK